MNPLGKLSSHLDIGSYRASTRKLLNTALLGIMTAGAVQAKEIPVMRTGNGDLVRKALIAPGVISHEGYDYMPPRGEDPIKEAADEYEKQLQVVKDTIKGKQKPSQATPPFNCNNLCDLFLLADNTDLAARAPMYALAIGNIDFIEKGNPVRGSLLKYMEYKTGLAMSFTKEVADVNELFAPPRNKYDAYAKSWMLSRIYRPATAVSGLYGDYNLYDGVEIVNGSEERYFMNQYYERVATFLTIADICEKAPASGYRNAQPQEVIDEVNKFWDKNPPAKYANPTQLLERSLVAAFQLTYETDPAKIENCKKKLAAYNQFANAGIFVSVNELTKAGYIKFGAIFKDVNTGHRSDNRGTVKAAYEYTKTHALLTVPSSRMFPNTLQDFKNQQNFKYQGGLPSANKVGIQVDILPRP